MVLNKLRSTLQRSTYLAENVGALLDKRDGRIAEARGELHSKELLLLGRVVNDGVEESDSSEPRRHRVLAEETSA